MVWHIDGGHRHDLSKETDCTTYAKPTDVPPFLLRRGTYFDQGVSLFDAKSVPLKENGRCGVSTLGLFSLIALVKCHRTRSQAMTKCNVRTQHKKHRSWMDMGPTIVGDIG